MSVEHKAPDRVAVSRKLPSVGVAIPCYNYAQYLAVCLDSVLSQTGVDLDVVVVDDASTDNSRAVVEEYMAKDPRVRLVVHETNKGHIATFNDGMDEICGDYLVLISADDALVPGALARAAGAMESHPSIGFTYGPVVQFSDELPAETKTKQGRLKIWSGQDWVDRRCRVGNNTIFSPEVVMRREVYERIDPYNPKLRATSDLAMWLNAAAVSDVGFLPGAPAAFYRQHGQNMHNSMFDSGTGDGILVDVVECRRAIDEVFNGRTGKLPNSPRQYEQAKRAIAVLSLELASRAYTWGLTKEWPVDGLEQLARETWPEYETLPQWRALKRRRELGPARSARRLTFVAREKLLDVREAWRARRREWSGA